MAMKLRTEIERIPLSRPIDRGEGIMLLGSCFTDPIGQWLSDAWLPVSCNPFGVLFNPSSIAQALMRVSGYNGFQGSGFPLHSLSGRYYSFDHHGKWSGNDPEALQAQLQQLDLDVQAFLAQTKHLIVTFGTSWVYEREGRVVANCHKFPASEFTRRRLSVDEIVEQWSQVIEALNAQFQVSRTKSSFKFQPSDPLKPDPLTPETLKPETLHPEPLKPEALNPEALNPETLKLETLPLPPTFTFTVSPIRHVKDTLHGNQLSKATLLLAIDELQRLYPDRVQYLPVYELLMDDLRDYRFYADDLVHPSSMAIEAVRELVMDTAMTPCLRQYMHDAAPIVRALQHRPSDPDSPQYKAFLAEALRKKEQLVKNI